jgi:hypothetical protein
LPDFSKHIEIFTDILGAFKRQGNEYFFYCPKCNYKAPKLSVNFSKNKFRCFTCGLDGNPNWWGKLDRLVKEAASESELLRWFELTQTKQIFDLDRLSQAIISGDASIAEDVVPTSKINLELEFPADFLNLHDFQDYKTAQEPLQYLISRGIPIQTIHKWQMGYSLFGRYHHRIVVPSHDLHGRLNYFIARSYNPDCEYRYFNSRASKDIIFNEFWIDWSKGITLVEGVFDALKVSRGNAIPLLGSELSPKNYLFKKLLEHKPRIFLALDPDAKKRQTKIAKNLMAYGLEVISVTWKGDEDFGDKSPEEVEEILRMADSAKAFSDYNFLMEKILEL